MSSALSFPYESENNHPHYLWNEQEYILRMLMQHSIGVSIDETASHVTVSHNPALSLNFTANGPADFPSHDITEQFATNQTRWIYLSADGLQFYISAQKPNYNQYLHGWYHPSLTDRAVVFIDSEQPANYRYFIMDSQNCMTEYNWRIPDNSNNLVFQSTTPSQEFPFDLTPGNYLFKLKGGKGGKGGNVGNLQGGQGASAIEQVFKLTVISTIRVVCILGADGSDGAEGAVNTGNQTGTAKEWAFVFSRPSFTAGWTEVGGGGGSSGEDSIIKIQSNGALLVRAVAGAGGGGAMRGAVGSPNNLQMPVENQQYKESHGAGGGGAGSGIASAGQIQNGYSGTITEAGQPGGAVYGGLGGLGNYFLWKFSGFSGTIFGRSFNQAQQSNPVIGNHTERGKSGQDLSVGFRRNGGDSKSGAYGPMGDGAGLVSTTAEGYLTASGGKTVKSSSDGYLRIYKTRDVA